MRIGMNEEKLTHQQQAAAQLLATGSHEKQEIAKIVGISRTTLYHYMKQDKFIAEVDRLKREFRTFGKELMESKLVEAVNGYWDLIKGTDNSMVAAKGYEFFIERSLGKLTNKAEITVEATSSNLNSNDIKEVFDQIEEEE
ncbi:DNA-binding CsgD family transcriptional regulator [Neobacillus niacini]|uniref:phBC6A51 family helix-turn-helix protein n=1 Tax=Neobacillus niacini TaxID=86668 RepID=UPI002783E3E3|nr:phBC6A51 family helix-turn-helix protein [Neobacillus niacini]MDQ1003977.1 DNA-binding CsgD family transcriptional regulator [Neobacillus niacini]